MINKIFCVVAAVAAFAAAGANPKYIFLFIGDGMSTPQRMTAEEFSRKTGNGPLAMNALPVQGSVRTCSADAIVTDSAAAATAFACGVKSNNHYIGVDAAGKAVKTCAEIARDAGKKTGIITTVTMTHATPAAFYAHCKNRGQTYDIALQIAKSGFDFFAGGGPGLYGADKKSPRYAKYGDAYEYAASNGYKIVRHRKDFLALKPGDGKILTNFTESQLDYAIDHRPQTDQPTFAEMVEKGIEMLDGPQGFFIMAEGGDIDWSGHANDAATNLRSVLAMDEGVKKALAFMEKHPDETLIIVTGDHETGGMSMGFSGTGYALYLDLLAGQRHSMGAFAKKVDALLVKKPDTPFEEVKPLITRDFGLKFSGNPKKDRAVLTVAETKAIHEAFRYDRKLYKAKVKETTQYDRERRYRLGGACRLALSQKAGIGWSTGSHTAMPCLVTAAGAHAADFGGFMENSELGRRLSILCGK